MAFISLAISRIYLPLAGTSVATMMHAGKCFRAWHFITPGYKKQKTNRSAAVCSPKPRPVRIQERTTDATEESWFWILILFFFRQRSIIFPVFHRINNTHLTHTKHKDGSWEHVVGTFTKLKKHQFTLTHGCPWCFFIRTKQRNKKVSKQCNKWFKQALDTTKNITVVKNIKHVDKKIRINSSKLWLLGLPPSSRIPSKLVNESASVYSLQDFPLVVISGREGRWWFHDETLTSLCAEAQ